MMLSAMAFSMLRCQASSFVVASPPAVRVLVAAGHVAHQVRRRTEPGCGLGPVVRLCFDVGLLRLRDACGDQAAAERGDPGSTYWPSAEVPVQGCGWHAVVAQVNGLELVPGSLA